MNPSASIVNPADKYIQVISVDNHEFWFMGFLNYEGAVTSLQESLQDSGLRSVWVIDTHTLGGFFDDHFKPIDDWDTLSFFSFFFA